MITKVRKFKNKIVINKIQRMTTDHIENVVAEDHGGHGRIIKLINF